jgi:hypothetical protein
MQLYEMQVNKTAITRAAAAKVPYGVIGAVVRFSFSPEWEGLSKTVVFRAGDVTKDILDVDQFAVIPAECTQELGQLLEVGVYGVDAENTVAIPTMWEAIGKIAEATDPSGDASTEPTLPVWAQLQERIRLLEETGVSQAEIEKAINAYFDGNPPTGKKTEQGGEIYNFYTDPVYTGDNPPKEYPGNTAAKGAHAQNFGTHADGEYSSASGWNSTANGGIANATGRETLASGYAATTEGHLTTASGRCAHAGGKESKAMAENAFAFGEGATASGKNAFACGKGSKASNTQSFAIGNATEASGSSSFAGGLGTKATASQSIATGNGAEATGVNSFAHGIKAKSTSNTSFAIGEETEAGGYYAIASGFRTKALGTCTMAGGRDTEVKAEAYAATAIGRGTIANSRYQFVRGQYNKPDEPDPNNNYIGQYVEIVGNGTASSPENIYTLDWDGNGWFSGDVYVGEFYGRHKKLATEDKLPKTAADVGAAPGGYGLGVEGYYSSHVTDLDSATKNGWYNVDGQYSPVGQYGVLRVDSSREDRLIHQTFYPASGGLQGYILRRYCAVGSWQPWEWFNPPMDDGVEYRTTERNGGLPVYVKTFAFQPNVTTTFGTGEYDHGITGFKYLCRVEARTESNVLPLITNDRTVCISGVTREKVKISATKQDFTDYVSVTLWYTKN